MLKTLFTLSVLSISSSVGAADLKHPAIFLYSNYACNVSRPENGNAYSGDNVRLYFLNAPGPIAPGKTVTVILNGCYIETGCNTCLASGNFRATVQSYSLTPGAIYSEQIVVKIP